MPNRVVITGIGIVAPGGIGKDEFMRSLYGRAIAPEPIPACFERHYRFTSRYYVPLSLPDPTEQGIPMHHRGFIRDAQLLAVVAAKLALTDAGYQVGNEGRSLVVPALADCAVWLGTGFTGLHEGFSSYLAHILGESAAPPDQPGCRFDRLIIPVMMPSSPAAWISILFQLRGSCRSLSASCASGTMAIGEAFREVRDGYAPAALAGGLECLKDGRGSAMRGFDLLGALTRAGDGRPTPFSAARSGFLFSEGGACVLVLEELGRAQRRGAAVYAEIADYRSNSDAHSIVQVDGEGTQIRRMLEELKGDRTIDYLNAHGTGTASNDEVEARIIRQVFGGRGTQPRIDSTKGIIGHTIGASGAIEAAVTAFAIRESRIHGSVVPEPLDDLNLALPCESLPIRYAITTSYGFGGHNAGLLLRKSG